MEKKYFHNSVFFELDLPDYLKDQVNLSITNKCPRCKQPWSKGELPPGIALEIECRRCKLKIIEIVPFVD